jgi:hypothetical protein
LRFLKRIAGCAISMIASHTGDPASDGNRDIV